MSLLGRDTYSLPLRAVRKVKRFFLDDRGSISVVTIGLFSILLLLSMILTNISTVYFAKRDLTLITEAAVQRGMKNLDAEKYYSGKYNLTQMLQNSLGAAESDPGIPIDCEAGIRNAQEIFSDSNAGNFEISSTHIAVIRIRKYECDGFRIYIESGAKVTLPIPIPFIRLSEVEIQSYAGAIGERAKTNNYYGLDIG